MYGHVFFFVLVFWYPASRDSFDLPRQIGKRKETLRAGSRFFDPPLIRENGWVSPVSCRWNRFLLTRMINLLFLSGFSTAIRMHKCRDHGNCTRANKLSLGASDWTIPKPIKLITFSLTKIIRFIRSLKSRSVRSPKTNTRSRQIRANACRFAWSQSHSCMRMAVEKPDLPLFSYKFQGIFNVTVFSELAHHT